ncbi:TPA: hypothetical protein HJU68_001921 [Escherichia coli]|nr:hypothetical protein [Escherichia coli]
MKASHPALIAGCDVKASHPALIAGCGVNALSGLHLATAPGLIRRDSVASGVDYRMHPIRGLISQAKQ